MNVHENIQGQKECDEGSFNLSKSKKNVRPYGKLMKDNKKLVRNEYEAKDQNDIAGACAACALRCESYAVADAAVRGVAEQ
jgi:hypothetical protein